MAKRAVKFIGRAWKEVKDDDVSGAASELTYQFFLAIFPFLIFLATLGAFSAGWVGIEDPTAEVMSMLGDTLPPDAASLMQEQIDAVLKARNSALLSLGLFGAIWAASGGLRSLMKAMNRAYDVEESRPLWRRYGLSILLTVGAGALVLVAFSLLIAGRIAVEGVADRIGLGDGTRLAIDLGRWPAALLLLIVAMAVLYWAAPNIDLPFQWVTPGAVLFCVTWLAGTFLFGLYVENFGSYNKTYGALGTVVIMLVWLYLSSFIMLVGAEVNALVYRVAHAANPIGDPGGVSATAGEKTDPGMRDPGTQETAGASQLTEASGSVAPAAAITRRRAPETLGRPLTTLAAFLAGMIVGRGLLGGGRGS